MNIEIAQCQLSPGDAGELCDSFRYICLNKPVRILQEATCILVMSTKVADGDRFHDAANFDGLSPLVHPQFSTAVNIFQKASRESIKPKTD